MFQQGARITPDRMKPGNHAVRVMRYRGRVRSLRCMAPTEDAAAGVADGLTSWRDGPAKRAIVEFVARVNGGDWGEPVPVEERVAVFDNDGTLWCEKPLPI
jgi:hypothetical protein